MSVPLLSIVTVLNDALALASVLTPMIQTALADGRSEVSEEDVSAARDKLAWAINSLDAEIAAARRGTP